MPASQSTIITAALKLPRAIQLLILQCTAIVLAMMGNPYFATPTPTLAIIQAAIAALTTAEVAARARTKGAATARTLQQKALIKLMGQLRDYVQSIANSMPGQESAVIVSAKMLVKVLKVRVPRVFVALHGAVSGSVLLLAPRVANRKSVYWEWSTDQKTWNSVPPTLKASTIISGLTPATMYYFRFQVLTKDGLTNWSQIVSLLVQ